MTLIGTGIAAATGPIFVNLLISHFGWRAGFLGISAVTLFGVIPIVIVLFRSPTKTVDQNIAAPPGGIVTRENSGIALRDAIRHRDFWRLGVGFFIVSLGIASSIVHLIPLMTDRGIIRESAAGIAGMLGLAVIAGRLACGYLVDRFNPPMIAGACLLVPALGSVVLIFAGADTQWLILGALMIGIAAGAEVDLVAFLTGRQFGLSAFGTILGWQLAMFGAGAALGPFMLGLMRDYFGNYETGLWVYAGCYVCGSILIMGLGPAVRSDHPKIA